ncbi:MAG: hypothetical protein ACTSPB_05425 [Candidatus Thorarchaeota archaeon]
MIQLQGQLQGPVFAADSKRFYREWVENGFMKRFKGLFSVLINPERNEVFETHYKDIMDELLDKFKLETKRSVLKASEIGSLFGVRNEEFESFCSEFARRIMLLEDVKISIFFTTLNKNYLEDGKVTVFGEYGTATQKIPIPELIDLINSYYNIISCWKFSKITNIERGMFLLDGTDGIRPCQAVDELMGSQYVKIIFNGDRVIPAIATSDILARYLDFGLREKRGFINESMFENIIFSDDSIPRKNKFITYIGNPDLDLIKPTNDSCTGLSNFKDNIHHPIIFLSAGGIAGQTPMIENTPRMNKILEFAFGMCAGIRFYNPRKDRFIIGKSSQPDYFIPFNDVAEAQLQTLINGGINVEELPI